MSSATRPVNILILSLLRLGDAIQHLSLLPWIRQKYPGCHIQMMINDEARSILSLVDQDVDQDVEILIFPRRSIQAELVEKDRNLLFGFVMFHQWIQKNLSKTYDVVYNFTNTQFSVDLCHWISSGEFFGFYRQNGVVSHQGSQWLQYLNDKASEPFQSEYHYLDLLQKSFFEKDPVPLQKVSTSKQTEKRILFQIQSSDVKKDLRLDFWKELALILCQELPTYQVMALGTAKEIQFLSQALAQSPIQWMACDLSKAKQLLSSSSLLVTVDTSIKHLANSVGCPVVELSLGSSDYILTGSRGPQDIILSSVQDCYPCSHSKACSQPFHRCEFDFQAKDVAKIIYEKIQELNIKSESLYAKEGV